MTDPLTEARYVIDNLGGTVKAAEFCEVSKGAVSQWLSNGIPRTQRKFLLAVKPEAFNPPAPAVVAPAVTEL